MIIKAAARHSPSTCDGSSVGVLGGEQAAARHDYRVRGETLPHRRSNVVAKHQPSVASLSAHLRPRLVDHLANQQPKDQLARAGSIGIDRSHHYVTLIEGEHVRISTMIEKHLERVPTMVRDANDQHVVIIAQKVVAASVGNRAPPHGARLARRCPGRGERADTLFVCERVRKAAANKRQPQRAERAMYTDELGGLPARS